ncbi:MAG: hypothetical protein WCJ30_13835, partial [Deltaproteobacteria bacterium]
DPRSDLFSLGLVAWEILAGKQARSGSTDAVMMAKVALDSIKSIASEVPDLPPKVIEVVDRMCALDPDDRYSTGEETAAALLEAIGTFPVANPLETGRADLGKLVVASVKKDVEAGGGNTGASRTVDAGRPMALTLHSLVVQQDGGNTLSRPLSDEMLKAIAPADFRGTSRTRAAARRRRSATLPLAAALGAVALLAVGVVMRARAARSRGAGATAPVSHVATLAPVVPVPEVHAPVRVPEVRNAPPVNADAGAPVVARVAGPPVRGNRPPDRNAHPTLPPGVSSTTPATLGISVRPWGNVRIDGGGTQEAPIRVTLAPGSHTVTVSNPERQVTRTLHITLAPGERNIQTIDLTHE